MNKFAGTPPGRLSLGNPEDKSVLLHEGPNEHQHIKNATIAYIAKAGSEIVTIIALFCKNVFISKIRLGSPATM